MISEMAADLAASQLGASSVAKPSSAMQTNYNFSLSDIAKFESAYYRVSDVNVNGAQAARTTRETPIEPVSLRDSPALKVIFGPIETLNGTASTLAREAQALTQTKNLTPAEVLQLTMRCHEFVFQCQLTSSIAKEGSNGVQQLFRQQS